VKQSKNQNKKIPLPVTVAISIFIVIAGVIIYFLFLIPEKTPAKKFAYFLAKQDIKKPNIIFFTLDTTRADHLPCYGYKNVKTPVLDSLAKKGILFEQCITPTALTLPSHSSIMTGLYPTFHNVRINGNTALSDKHLTMAEIFSQQGYQCGAFIAAFVLDGRWGLKQGFDFYDDKFDLKKYKQLDLAGVQRPGNEIIDAALTWMEEQKENPFFSWIHFYDPHTPYEPPEPYLSQYKGRGLVGMYDGEIAFMDEQIGRCISWLKENELDKKSIIVIMGDHGEGLGDHGELTHGYFIYEYAVHVPFLIITPFESLQGLRIPTQVRTIDLYPTLLEMLGFQIPAEAQGKSLLPLIFSPQAEEERYVYIESMTPSIQYGWSSLQSLRTSNYKYIEAPRPELYDLSKDPLELDNLNLKQSKRVRTFKKDLSKMIDETSRGAPKPESANLDSETIKKLATLGYIGAPVSVSRKSSKKGEMPLADPKDKFEIFKIISQSAEWINLEKYHQAADSLESVLKEDPLNPQARLLLASCYIKLEKTQEAKTHLDVILKEDPNSVQALITLANILADEGKKEDVLALCKKTLAVDNLNTQAHTLIGEMYMSENNFHQALPYLNKAVEIQPKLTQNRQNLAVCLLGLKQYDKAASILEDIIIKYPKFPLAHFHLGLLYEEQGRLEEAKKAYLEEFTNYEKCIPARFNYGKLLFKSGDRSGYIEQMKELIKIAPEQPKGYLFLARGLLYENVDMDHIQQLVQKGLQLAEEPELKALAYFLLADIYTRKNQPDKVKEALEKGNYYKSK